MPLQSNPCNPQTSLSHIVLCIIYILYFHIFYIVFAQLCFFFPTHNCIFVFLCCTKNCEKQEAVSRRHYILGQPNLFGLNFSQFLKKEEKESESIIVMKMKVKASHVTSHYILRQPNTLTQFSLNF